ncbi:hypothetical protein LINPERHAP1_LOCUS36794 [Linum perenne]
MCNPDCQFIYCLAGWEGFVHDARVLRDAVARSSGLKVPKANQPTTPKEYYSMKHASARNVIERAFGRIVHACYLLHNFIKQEASVDALERAYLQQPSIISLSMAEEMDEMASSMQPSPKWTNFRNRKAQQMWQSRTRQ